jgi:hypothetical protein
VGWLEPVRANTSGPDELIRTTYRVFVEPAALQANTPTELDARIVDQFGKRFSDFDVSSIGRFSSYAYLTVVSRDLSTLKVAPLVIDPYTPLQQPSGGGAMGMSADKNSDVPTLKFEERVIPSVFTLPEEGQYTAFVQFWPRGDKEILLTAPIQVGKAVTPAAALTPDADLAQTVGELTVRLNHEAAFKVGQYQYIQVSLTDQQGLDRTKETEMLSGDQSGLYIVDQGLTTFLRPEFVNRDKLQFSVKFPKRGLYKAWFEFVYAGELQQAAFVFAVD